MLTDDEILTLNIAVFDADGDNDVHVSAPDEDLLAFARVIERTAIEAALAAAPQSQGEPVAWRYPVYWWQPAEMQHTEWYYIHRPDEISAAAHAAEVIPQPLYAHPPTPAAQRRALLAAYRAEREAIAAQPSAEPVGMVIDPNSNIIRSAPVAQPSAEPPKFPTMLRKMWSGGEVQHWINANWSAQPSADPWRDAVEQMLATTEQTASDDPRESLDRLIDWHVAVAMDPLVSSDARALIQRGRDEAAAQPSAEPSLVRAARDALEFCEFGWRDVPMNEHAFARLELTIDALRRALDAGGPSYIVETSADGAGWHTVSTHASADAAIAAMHDVAGRLPGLQTARVRVEGDAPEAKGGGR